MKLKIRKRSNISHKKVFLTIGIFLFTCMTIGFAYLEARININGAITISDGRWNVHFANLTVANGSVETPSPATISANGRKISVSVNMLEKDDFYEFEADIVNDGVINAMISEVKLSNIPESLKPFLVYNLMYTNGHSINKNDLLSVGSSKRINFNLKFLSGADLSELPIDGESFDLELEILYVQATDEVIASKKVNLIQKLGLDFDAYSSNTKSQFVTSESGISYSAASSNTNGKGLYIFPGTEEEKSPIYFYRGAVTDNNLIFAGFCWKIVRTTEKGGTKLIYNGLPTDTNQCTNTTGTATQLSNSVFNSSTAAKYVGYMYDTNTDSTVKTVVDEWYYNNLKYYTSYLEDAVWCNDMSVSSTSGSNIYYGAYKRLSTNKTPKIKDSETCSNPGDRYTVSTKNGNGKLQYPVGLLTADEVALGGFVNNSSYVTTTSYLYTNSAYWTMSPVYYSSRAYVYVVWNTGCFLATYNNNNYGVRPSIVLNSEVVVTEGEGTSSNPYIVSVEPAESQRYYMPFNGEEGYADNEGSQYISTYKGVNLSTVASDTNGKGLYIIGDTLEDEYPIYYYRGAVTNNNVLFANYCWKIVRTTETGGTKLLYNGVPSNGQCTATGTATQFSTTAMFNSAINNSKYVGYMYDTNTNSTVKTAIDNWYSSNMTGYTYMLEDAVWCNDMSVSSTSSSDVYFGAYKRLWTDKIPKVKDAETCPNESDRYTISTENGNGKLTYPVGLLTADELIYGGVIHVNNVFNTTTYLYTGQTYWTMTPEQYTSSKAGIFMMWEKGSTVWDPANTSYGVRPAISLRPEVVINGGDGTTTNPYIV